MGNTCKTCINNDDGLCDRKGILVEDEDFCEHHWAAGKKIRTMRKVQMRKRMQKHSMMATLRDIPHMYMWMIQKRIRRFRTTVEHGTWASTTAVGCSVLSTTEIQ